MDKFKRYGIYVVPEGAFFDTASTWLGWDSAQGREVVQPDVAGLPEPVEHLTATPRRYGFHGTIKPPFFLAKGCDARALDAAAQAFCATRPPMAIPELSVRCLGRFVAIVPSTPSQALADLAGATVEALDAFRAPPSEAELARRRKAGLSDRQEALLGRWGYPYVMEEFRFHLTLTGTTDHAGAVRDVLARHFAAVLPAPFIINSLSMMGEDAEGRFHLIQRYAFSG